MAHSKLQSHAYQSHSEGLALRFVCLVLSHVGKALMQAGLKGETKGMCERPDDEAHDAPVMPPKVGGFALGFAFLMQGDDPRHTPGIFDDIGVITKQDSASRHYNSRVLVQNQAAPVRDQGIETPASIMASATPFFFCTTQKHLIVKIASISMA
jgi:hypothetical protein